MLSIVVSWYRSRRWPGCEGRLGVVSFGFGAESVGIHVTLFWPIVAVVLLLIGFLVWKLAQFLYSLFG